MSIDNKDLSGRVQQCLRCGEEKPLLVAFSPVHRHLSGRSKVCTRCYKEVALRWKGSVEYCNGKMPRVDHRDEFLRICTICNLEKGMNEFYVVSGKASGLDSYCRTCRKGYDQEKRKWAPTRSQRRIYSRSALQKANPGSYRYETGKIGDDVATLMAKWRLKEAERHAGERGQ